ncbi:MAG: hydroxyethylthiazole kinase [Pseudomonadota bacterium]
MAAAASTLPALPPSDALTAMRGAAPLTHCITNYVAMAMAANAILAAGASPAMIHAEEEVADFVPVAAALTINIGTLSAPWAKAMLTAAETANDVGKPWVLDPVAHFATPYRSQVTKELATLKPSIIRGNASEIITLAGEQGAGKGVDSGDSVDAATSAAKALAEETGAIVAVTGETDLVTNGTRSTLIAGGSERMPKITAMGCALTGVMGAYAAVAAPFEAAIAACAHFAEAGTQAHKASQGPGSFLPAFMDALEATDQSGIAAVSVGQVG